MLVLKTLSLPIQRRTSRGEKARLSTCPCDLSTNHGVRKANQVVSLKKPKHVWMSPIRGPHSMMQHVNQSSIQQCEDLAQKRRDALKQHVGCSIIYTYASNLETTLENDTLRVHFGPSVFCILEIVLIIINHCQSYLGLKCVTNKM